MKHALIIAITASTTIAQTAYYAAIGNSDLYSADPNQPNFNPFHPDFDLDNDGILNKDDFDQNGDGVADWTQFTAGWRLLHVENICFNGYNGPSAPNSIEFCDVWQVIGPNQIPYWPIDTIDELADNDGDGLNNRDDIDEDNDGLRDERDPDSYYFQPTNDDADVDGDGIKNYLDPDIDGDGCPNEFEEDLQQSEYDPTDGGDCSCQDLYNGTEQDWDNDGCPNEMDPDPCDPVYSCDPNEPPDAPLPGSGNPGGEPNDPDAPDPDNPDAPDLPDMTNDPDDPNEPTEPTEPDGGDPDLPEPDPMDACCAALTTRLDLIIQWADYNTGWNRNTFEELKLIREDLYQFMYDMVYGQDYGDGEPGILQTNNLQNAEMIAQLEQQNIWAEHFNEYFSDQTWYLEQLYRNGLEIEFEEPDYTEPSNEDDFTPTDPTSKLIQLKNEHITAQSEHDNVFRAPDLSEFEDETEPPVMYLPTHYIGFVFGVPMEQQTIDFAGFIGIRNVFHSFLYVLVTINCVHIVWEELRKT